MPSSAALRQQIETAFQHRYPSVLTPSPKTIREVVSTGIPPIDAILNGGIPVGAITEITGPASSGRTSIAISALASRTREGSVCAWIDAKYSLDPEKQKKLIRMTLAETERLNSLTNNILFSSQLEAERYKSDMEELDLSDLFKDCVHQFQNRYPERTFTTAIEIDMDIKGDIFLLQMLINNLLENAIKYSSKEKPITCALKKNNQTILMSIADEGEGIADEEKPKIFERFYRIGNELTRKTQGTGLGLYLSKIISQYHNADISVTNNIPAGSIFTVSFKI